MRPLVPALLLSFLALSAGAQLPQRDLVVDVRQIEEGQTGYGVSTRPQTPLLAPQQVQMRNGSRAQLGFTQAIPLLWVKEAHAAGPQSGAGVKQGLTWLQAGQQLKVHASWPGGQRPVTVEVEVLTASVEAQPGADLPTQQRGELVTTVQAPLGQWVTIARSGQSAARGSYSSDAASQRPRLLQLRVTAP